MSLTERLAPISTLARQCLISFERCLRGTSTLDSQRYSTIEDQMARFSIWTSNMAVFASGKACMDHRVREAPEILRLILGILEILQGRIDECICLVERLVDPHCSVESRYSVLAQGDFEKTADGISSEVGLLHELSNTIRKASRESHDVKVATSFRLTDDDGYDIEDILKEYFVKNLRDRFPESSDAICNRLAATMILRRKRILYRRSRYAVNPIKPTQPVLKPTVQTQIVPRQPESEEQPQLPSQAIKLAAAPSRIYSVVQSATTLTPRNFQRASAPSVVSQVKSVDLGSHEDLVFPPRPENSGHSIIEVTCPYCLYVLPGLEVSNKAQWRKHILGDLDALVCLFDPCDEPEVLYRHSRDWLRHMRKHAQRWRCSAKSHGIQKFGSREEFENHMKESHRKHYTNAQLDLLAERSTRSSGQLFEVCPLCGGKDSAEDGIVSGSLIDHIVGHLRSLALKSLPPHYEDNDNDPSNSHDDESVKSRSTIRNILDDDNISLHSLHFPDVQRHDSPDRDAGDWDFLQKVIIHEVIPEPQEEDDDDEPIKASRGRLTSTLSTKKESTETDPIPAGNSVAEAVGLSHPRPIDTQHYDEDEYDDDYNDIDINPGGDEIQSIIPTYEGFRQHILRLNPLIPETSTYLIDRIATHCVVRLKRLKDARTNHLDLVIRGSCPSRTLCLAMGGETLRLGVRGKLQWSDDDSSIDGPIKPQDFPRGIPMPPAASLPAELECQLCFRHKKLYKPSDWTKHVHEDLMPFTCTWESCREPKMFKRKADWVRHENEAHRHLEWWSCDVDDCRHICYRQDNFLKHLVREHRFPEPTLSQAIGTRRRDPTWMALEQCHVETQSNPSTEPCRFCGKTFTAWKRLTIHLAKHMEHISLPILKLAEESENQATELEADPTPQNFDSLQISAEQEHRAYSNALRDALGAEPPGVPLPGLGGAGWVEPSGAPLPSLDDMGLRHAREALPGLVHIGRCDHLKLGVLPSILLTQRDLPMVDHFVQFVLPDIFPIQQLSQQGQSISDLILTALQTNESYLHCCLMVASYHYKTTMKIESESVDTNVLQHHSALVKGIRELLDRKEDYEQVLQTTLSLITFQCHVGIYDSSIIRVPFYEHIRGTTSVAHALELPGLVSNSKQPEGFDRLYISMIAWVDILSSTMKGSPPYFARIYRERYLSRDNNDLGLVNLMGCEDHVMYLISEIACLDALKKEGIDDDTVRQHITVLEEQLDDVKMRESAPEIFINGSLNLRQLTHYITEAFLTAAKLYLQSLSPGFYTQRLDCMGKVERITELLHNIPPGPKGYDRSLVWVYLVCGSVSMPSSSFRPFFNDRVAQLGDAAKLGSFGGLVSVLQEIWHPTAPGDPSSTERSLHPRWRHAMMRKGWDYLLI